MDNQAVGRRVWEAVGGQKNVKSWLFVNKD